MIALLVVAILFLWTLWWQQRPAGCPPGPFRIPVIGNLANIGSQPTKTLPALGEKYNGIFSIQLGKQLVVVISDPDAVYEGLKVQGLKTAGRPTGKLIYVDLVTYNGRDMAMSPVNSHWATFRKLFHAKLFSPKGLENVESHILPSLRDTVAVMRRHADSGEALAPNFTVKRCTLNMISSQVFSYRFEENNAVSSTMIEVIDYFFEMTGSMSLLDFIPFLRYFPIPGIAKVKDRLIIRNEFLMSQMNEHEERLFADPNNPAEPRDFTDLLMLSRDEQRKVKAANANPTEDDKANYGGLNTYEDSSNFDLSLVLYDLIAAGVDTTATTTLWALAIAANYPDTQKKLQEELDSVLGKGDIEPTLDLQERCPYLNAFVKEIMRFRVVAPTALPHESVKDFTMTVRGQQYTIPKDTLLFFDLVSVHHSKEKWGDPENFRPERFLGEVTPETEKKYWVPFSMGPRSCVGMPLAKAEIFFIFSRLFHQFEFASADGKPIDLDGLEGLTYHPKPYQLKIKRRY